MIVNIAEIGIKVKLTEGKLKAIVGLDFGDFVIRGYRVQESQYPNKRGDNIWVTPPAYLGGGKYHPIVFFPDKSLWDQMEGKILDAYKEASDNRNKKAYELSDEEAAEVGL